MYKAHALSFSALWQKEECQSAARALTPKPHSCDHYMAQRRVSAEGLHMAGACGCGRGTIGAPIAQQPPSMEMASALFYSQKG